MLSVGSLPGWQWPPLALRLYASVYLLRERATTTTGLVDEMGDANKQLAGFSVFHGTGACYLDSNCRHQVRSGSDC